MRIKPEVVIHEIDEYLEQTEERPWGNFEILMMNAKDIIESQQRQLDHLAGEKMSLENQLAMITGYGMN